MTRRRTNSDTPALYCVTFGVSVTRNGSAALDRVRDALWGYSGVVDTEMDFMTAADIMMV